MINKIEKIFSTKTIKRLIESDQGKLINLEEENLNLQKISESLVEVDYNKINFPYAVYILIFKDFVNEKYYMTTFYKSLYPKCSRIFLNPCFKQDHKLISCLEVESKTKEIDYYTISISSEKEDRDLSQLV